MRSKNAISRGFILPDGRVARSGTQHDDIAMNFICDEKLLSQFDRSIYKDPCDFMVYKLHAIKVGCNLGNPKVITFVEDYMSKEQWIYIEYYQYKGYKVDMLKEPLAE